MQLVSLTYATSALGRCAQSKSRTVGTKCTLGLCCHNKPNPVACLSYSTTLSILSKHHDKTCGCEDKTSRKLKNLNSSDSSSSSFKGLSCVSSFNWEETKSGRSYGRIAAEWLESISQYHGKMYLLICIWFISLYWYDTNNKIHKTLPYVACHAIMSSLVG
ncbi:putative E3 ubiquitin-protein ligase XBAT31 [Spatholobus suberectus]|nr:putative E3 ubiquitin-protein ligase XBAT31 [Spatholobus suberectus]